MSVDAPTIAILGGTGREGRGLAIRWAATGYKIVIGSRDAHRAMHAANEINELLGIKSVYGFDNPSAALMADICVLTVTQFAHNQALESLKEFLHDKILVDATSRVDYKDPKPPDSPSAGEIAQQITGPSVRVVAAFQNVPAKLLSTSIGGSIDADVLVCSDDLNAAIMVVKLANDAGMRGFFAGRLANANVVEGMTSILISMNKHYGVKDASIKIVGIDALE